MTLRLRHVGTPTCLASLWATPVLAHSPLPGVEGFYTGLMHPFTSPAQLLGLLAVGLALGGFPLARMRPAFAGAALGLALGVIFGMPDRDPGQLLLLTATLAAGLAALIPGRALIVVSLLAAVLGIGLGWGSLPEPGPLRDRIITTSGAVTACALGLLYLTGTTDLIRERFNAPWVDIALRIVAAWIAAIAVLMLALMLA